MEKPISYSAAQALALSTGKTTSEVQADDLAIKSTAPVLLPKKIAELTVKRVELQKLESDFISAERDLVAKVHFWNHLLDSRNDLKRTLALDRDRRRRFSEALISLEANMSDFCSGSRTDEAKLVEVEKQIAQFASENGISLT